MKTRKAVPLSPSGLWPGQMKALREAKLETDWSVPNASYESAARIFSRTSFGKAGQKEFMLSSIGLRPLGR